MGKVKWQLQQIKPTSYSTNCCKIQHKTTILDFTFTQMKESGFQSLILHIPNVELTQPRVIYLSLYWRLLKKIVSTPPIKSTSDFVE